MDISSQYPAFLLPFLGGTPQAATLPDRLHAEGHAKTASRLQGLSHSLFHEPWWLNAVTGGNWDEAVVEQNGRITGRLPYVTRRAFGVTSLSMPPLTRTLGPQLPLGLPAEHQAAEHRKIMRSLLEQLPAHQHFRQIFDPALPDALPFYEMGYQSSLTYTVRIPGGWSLEERWRHIRGRLRNDIRRAQERLQISPVEIDEFCNFYNRHTQINNQLWWSRRFQREGDALKTRLYQAASARHAACLIGARDKDGNLQAAIMPVWGHGVMYYFLTVRADRPAGHGAIKLLMWQVIALAHAQGVDFDIDGFVRPSAVRLQLGFGGDVCNRINVTKSSALLDLAQWVLARSRFGV